MYTWQSMHSTAGRLPKPIRLPKRAASSTARSCSRSRSSQLIAHSQAAAAVPAPCAAAGYLIAMALGGEPTPPRMLRGLEVKNVV